jgi:hypothetical protein
MCFVGLEWVLQPEPEVAKPFAPMIGDLLVSGDFLASENKMEWLRAALQMSHEGVMAVAAQTAGQRENPLWGMVRALRVTASNFGCVLKAQRRNL